MDYAALLKGELWLTFDIVLGLLIGELILRFGLADMLMKRALPLLKNFGIGPVLGTALTISLGSSRAGAALVASALDNGRLSPRTALWGTLLLSFPGYLRRWPSTLVLSVSMAGVSGCIFALFLIIRSAARFVMILFILDKGEPGDVQPDSSSQKAPRSLGLNRRLLRTLPLAWIFYAVAFAYVPYLEAAFKDWFMGGTFLPLAAWVVAAASLAHVSASLAMAGGSLAAGELSVMQAVFALLLGNSLGIVTRAIRQNAGYYFGLFPMKLAQKLFIFNMATMLPWVGLSLLLAVIPLLY